MAFFEILSTAVLSHGPSSILGLSYLFRVHKITKDIESEKKKLISNRDLVQEKIDAVANNKVEKVNEVAFEWLKEMEKLMEEEKNLKIETEQEEFQQDIMPNPIRLFTWRRVFHVDHEMAYEMYKEMLKKLKALNSKCEFEPFSTPIPGLEYFSSRNFVCFKPTKEASDQLLEALQQDDNCYIIGLHGKRGSGKTKLVKAVGEKAKYLRNFDLVLFATVSQYPNVRRIQDEIADSLNLKFDRNTQVGRATKIYLALKNMDRPVLVILDDVQAKLELEDIGIPCNGNHKCKVLLTTRSQRECALLNCQREIPLGPLSEREAWILFKTYSGIDVDESSSLELLVARQVAFKCEGLPGTIKDVGSSLKGKPIEEWRALLESLRHSMARWQIFLSFRGEDTRYSFTGFLYDALCREGFKTFMDEGGLHNGDQISLSLINAIEASRLSIVILSENFAYSSWCLDELVKILECMHKDNQLVWPIFYKVDPSDIRHLRYSYGKAMAEHEKRFGNDPKRVQKWRSALLEVTQLSGKAYTTGYEYEFIQKLVEDANDIKNRLYIRNMDMDYVRAKNHYFEQGGSSKKRKRKEGQV